MEIEIWELSTYWWVFKAIKLDVCLSKRCSDWGKIKNVVRESLGDFIWKQTKRNPMILPIIMEVDL